MATVYLTKHQYEAYHWGRANYGNQLKRRLSTRPETLPVGYHHVWFAPFGRPDWNEYMRILRRLYWQGKICTKGMKVSHISLTS